MKTTTTLLGFTCLLTSLASAEIIIQKEVLAKPVETPGIVVPPPGATTEAARTDTIELLNGDTLHGTFLSLDAKGGARWQHPAVKQVMELNAASISKIKLERPKSTGPAPRQTCAARLTNGDELVGELISLDEEKLVLETWYAGSMTIPRKMIRSLSPGLSRWTGLYDGPTGIEGWTIRGNNNGMGMRIIGGRAVGAEGGSWKYSNGAFHSVGQGSIARDVKLPAMSNTEFDLAWRGYLQLIISLYTDNLDSYAGGNSYMLQLNYTSVNLQRMSRDGNSSSFGGAEVPGLNQKTKAHISIRANKETKTIALLMDGVLVKQWTDRAEFPGTGTGLMFFQQGQGILRISNIRVSDWDGKFEETASGKAVKSKDDLVKMVNNDKISGTLKSIKDGKMTFETAFAPLTVPVDRIDQIDLASEKSDKAPVTATDVRLTFGGRGSLTFQLDRWDDLQVTGTSPNFGKAKFTPAAFTSIQFNVDKVKPESDVLPMETLEIIDQ